MCRGKACIFVPCRSVYLFAHRLGHCYAHMRIRMYMCACMLVFMCACACVSAHVCFASSCMFRLRLCMCARLVYVCLFFFVCGALGARHLCVVGWLKICSWMA